MTTLRFLPRVERDAGLLLGSAHVNRDGSGSSTLRRYKHGVVTEYQWTLRVFHGRNLIPRVQILTALVPHTARDPRATELVELCRNRMCSSQFKGRPVIRLFLEDSDHMTQVLLDTRNRFA